MTIVTQWFEPEPAYRGHDFARDLVTLGYEVDVVTGFPNYPGGALYAGYKLRPMRVETVDGIQVTRLALYPSHDKNKIGRSLNYLSFMTSVLTHLLCRRRHADVIYVYHPPITVGLAAALAKPIRRFRLVLEVQDLWPDTLRATGMMDNKRIIDGINAACHFVYRMSDQIVVQSEGFRKKLRDRKVPAAKITKILNWAPQEALLASWDRPAAGFREGDAFRVLFAGNIGKAQGLDSVLKTAHLLKVSAPGVRLYLLGDGVERARLEARAASEGLTNVVFLPSVPPSEVGAFLAQADALLVHLRSDPLFEITIPSKTQAYLAVGKPIIVAGSGEAANLVTQAGAGLAAEPEAPAALAAAILKMVAMDAEERKEMGRKGKEFYESTLAKQVGMSAFDQVLRLAQQR